MNWLYVLFGLDILNLAVFLPVFAASVRSIGGTAFTLGVINSSSALVSLLWNPIVGSLSDQAGRKGLLVKCLITSAVGSLIMAFSSSSLILIFLGRVVGSIGSPVAILLRSIVGDIYKTTEEKKTFFNKSGPVISIAFLVGSVSSGFLSEAEYGFTKAYLLMALITGSAAFLANNTLPNDSKADKGKRKTKQSFLRKAAQELKRAALDIKGISWPRYKNLFLIKACYEFGVAIITANIGLIMLNEFHLKGRYMGYVFLMISVLSIISNILKLKLKTFFESITDHQMIIKGGLILIVSFIGMSVPSTVGVFLFFMALMFLPKAFVDTTFMEMVTSQTTEEDRGKVIGAFENLVPITGFIVPLVSGLAYETFGERLIVLSSIVPMGIAVLIARGQRDKKD